jgi:hypothetical protein
MWHDSILVSKVKSLQPSQGDSDGRVATAWVSCRAPVVNLLGTSHDCLTSSAIAVSVSLLLGAMATIMAIRWWFGRSSRHLSYMGIFCLLCGLMLVLAAAAIRYDGRYTFGSVPAREGSWRGWLRVVEGRGPALGMLAAAGGLLVFAGVIALLSDLQIGRHRAWQFVAAAAAAASFIVGGVVIAVFEYVANPVTEDWHSRAYLGLATGGPLLIVGGLGLVTLAGIGSRSTRRGNALQHASLKAIDH